MQVREVSIDEYAVWKSVLESASEGSPYQLPEYLFALATATGANVKLLGAFGKSGDLEGGVGLYTTNSVLGDVATSRLMLYYNGPFVKQSKSSYPQKRESHRRNVLQAIESHLSQSALRSVRFKVRCASDDYRSFLANGWTARPVYSYVIPLDNIAHQWRLVDANVKRLVRRGQKEGLRLNVDGDFDSFYEMHVEMHNRKGSPIYFCKPVFRALVQSLTKHRIGRIFQVSSPSGDPLASQLVLYGSGKVAHMLSAAGFSSAQNTGCNAFLRWQVCEWLAAHSYDALDLTDAHNPSVARFKAQFGPCLQTGLEFNSPQSAMSRMMNLSQKFVSRVGGKLSRIAGRGQ